MRKHEQDVYGNLRAPHIDSRYKKEFRNMKLGDTIAVYGNDSTCKLHIKIEIITKTLNYLWLQELSILEVKYRNNTFIKLETKPTETTN